MGLDKYGKIPENRVLARVNFNYYMFRDGDGVAYLGNDGTMRMVTDPENVLKGDACWGFSHEVGHVMQMRPMTWGGMTEVSNNIFSLQVAAKTGNESRLKRQGSYDKARKEIIEGEIAYLQSKDVFNKLVPLWQLHLYFTKTDTPTSILTSWSTCATTRETTEGTTPSNTSSNSSRHAVTSQNRPDGLL